MDEPMDYAAVCIELRNKAIKETAIVVFIFTPRGPCDQIGKLNQAGRLGIHEEGNFPEISEMAPSSPIYAKMPR
jgi:hypothetical protein